MTINPIVLRSVEDRSVNFVLPSNQETRYVRRTNDTIIVYLSSHNGCNQSCRMCHLTQTGQTDFVPTRRWEFIDQAKYPLTHYRRQVDDGIEPRATTLHYNWMARGEPLLNQELLDRWGFIRQQLVGMGLLAGIKTTSNIKFKISTILPQLQDNVWFNTRSGDKLPEIYYSLYSVNPEFRKRWFPKAGPLEYAAEKLKYHKSLGGRVVFHLPFIAGENDSDVDVDRLIEWIVKNELTDAKVNVVRYNPHSPGQGVEASEETIEKHFKNISSVLRGSNSRIVPRVGFDIAASCGCFVENSYINKTI